MGRTSPQGRDLSRGVREAARRPRGFEYFREVYAELRKAVWPSREQTTRLTMLVLAISISAGIALGVVDFVLGRAVSTLFF